MQKKVIIYILLLFLLPQAMAQSLQPEFKIYGFEDGLSHRNIIKIQQDTSGFIWLATINGLNKYDGYRFINYTKEDVKFNISKNHIVDMVIGGNNEIWLSHPNTVSFLKPFQNKLKSIPINTNKERGKEQTIFNLTSFSNGVLGAMFSQDIGESHLDFIDDKGNIQNFGKLSGSYSNHSILCLKDTLLLGILENELWKIPIDTVSNTLIFEEKKLEDRFSYPGAKPSFSRILEIKKGQNEEVFVLLENGQLYYKHPRFKFFQKHPLTKQIFKKENITTFFIDDEDNIWLGGRGVLLKLDYATGELIDLNKLIQEKTKYAPTYRQLFQDNSGVVWVASDFGAIKFPKVNKLFTTYLNSGNEYCSSGFCSMRGMTEDEDGNIYFTYYNSIHKLEKTTGVLMPLFRKNEFNYAPFGLAYHKGALWTGNGLRIDLKTLEIDTVFSGRNEDKGVVLSTENQLWFGHADNLTQYFDARNVKIEYLGKDWKDSTKLEITFLHKGQKSGNYWIGTNSTGLLKMNRSGQIEERFQVGDSALSLSHNRILSVYEDKQGNVWVATANGLNCLNFEIKNTHYYSTKDGLPNDFINAILPEGDSVVWLSTDNGLSRFDIKTETASNFYQKDGLPANEFNRLSAMRASDGRLFFGGLNGVVAFYPSPKYIAQKEELNNKLLLTNFSKFDGLADSLVNFSSGITRDSLLSLSWRDKFFTFNFALADFNNPDENRYTYKLEGYDKHWSEPTTTNAARYNNLPSGDYIFRVRGAAGTDDWNQEELTLPIKIEEAFYKSTWFISLAILLATGIVYGIMQYRLHLIRLREKILEKQVKQRTSELEEEKLVSDNLLLNILPAAMAEELKQHGSVKAKRHEKVTVFFSDIKDFTSIAQKLEPEKLVAEIDYIFRAFDEIIEKYDLEKIKTIGDAYMCAVGLSEKDKNGTKKIVNAALEIQEFMFKFAKERKAENRPAFEVRIGLHTGAVVAGIVGSKKFAYDIWGDTVNIASRMESYGEVGKVNISQTTYDLIKNDFVCHHRGKQEVKHKGAVDMYFVEKKV